MNANCILFLLLGLQYSSMGFYIPPAEEKLVRGTAKKRLDDWGVIQNTLGLSKQKVDLLKSQKDQQGTKDLLSRFINENPKYLTKPETSQKKFNDRFLTIYQSLIKKLKFAKSTLKTSLNFELADRPLKNLRRARRKIAVKMVSDMPSERVDDLLQIFYNQQNIRASDYDGSDNDSEYSDLDMPQHTPMDSDTDMDYAYDEGDVGLTAKSRQNMEYGSFQDLILQAKRNQWERESEETKLHSPVNDHFI